MIFDKKHFTSLQFYKIIFIILFVNFGTRRRRRLGSFQQQQRLVAHSTALESITAEVDDAAMADMVDETETVDKVSAWGGIPAKNSKGENLLLFIGGQRYFFTRK